MLLLYTKFKVNIFNVGLTLEKIIVGDLKSFWVPEQLYVAISRVRSNEAIQFLKSFNRNTNSYEPYTIEELNMLFFRVH